MRGVATDPESPRFHTKLGANLPQLERFDQAEVHIQKAIELDPALPDAWNSLGRLAFDQRRYAEAEIAYRTAIRLHPKFAVAYKNLVPHLLALRRLGRCGRVLRNLSGSSRMTP